MNRLLVITLALTCLLGCGGTLSVNGQRRERMIYVASATTRFVAAYDLDREDHDPGQPLDEIVYDYDLLSPAVSLTISPNQLWMFVVNEDGQIERYGIRDNGELSQRPLTVLPAGSANGPLVVSPDSEAVYIAADNGRIYQFSLSAGGVPTPMTPAFVAGPPVAADLAITPDGQALFASEETGNQIWRYTADGAGALTTQTPTSVVGGPGKLDVSPVGGKLLAACSSSDQLALFTVGSNAALTEVNRVAAPTGDLNPVVSEDGDFAYISTTNGSNEIWRYAIGATLSLLLPPRVTNHSEQVGAFLDWEGSMVIVNRSSNSYSRYWVNTDGTLGLRETHATISQPGLAAYRILP